MKSLSYLTEMDMMGFLKEMVSGYREQFFMCESPEY